MRQTLYLLAISLFFTSCATILNGPHKSITVYTTEPSKIILHTDTINTIDNKANFNVERRKEPIIITASTDNLTKEIEVEPKNSFMFWSNICNYGIGMFIDRKNPKRYSYPQRIYLNSTDTISRYYKYGKANNKGELLLHLSLPYINSFNLKPKNEGTKINTGFWGLTVGLDYYHSKNQFLNVGVSGVLDFIVPFPAPVDFSGEHEWMSSRYVSVSNNHKLGRFSLGYGLSYAKNTWEFRYYDRFDPLPPTREPIKRSHNAFGLIFPSYFQLGEQFNVGVIYRPTFYIPTRTNQYVYEHLISIDMAWKIRI